MIQRIEDPLDTQWSEPGPDSVRFHFVTGPLMERAGITQDMSREADHRYLQLLEPLASDIGELASIRATGYRYGPAAGGDDYAFIDLVIRGVALANAAGAILKAARWLRANGALEIRISERGVQTLARYELERRGLDGNSELLSLALIPGQGETPWGTPRPHSGYALVFKLRDGRLATQTFSLGGILQEVSLPPDVGSDVV